MKLIHEILVFIEPNCAPCDRVLNVVEFIQRDFNVDRFVVINRVAEPEYCMRFGVVIFPATFINGHLAFYGEFSVEDAQEFVNHSKHK